jgi:hypothetical protein
LRLTLKSLQNDTILLSWCKHGSPGSQSKRVHSCASKREGDTKGGTSVMSQRIRIESLNDEKGGSFMQIIDAETRAPLLNLAGITIKLETNNLVVADVKYNDGTTHERYVEKVDAVISDEAVDKQ